MKYILTLLGILLVLLAPAPKAVAQESVSMDFFYDNLQRHGTWREVGEYGYCWQPGEVDADWRPYSEGRWVYTDAGWTWDSDEAFGWAVYHYGRWANLEEVGWIWVPGMEWGPGWVSWRHSPSYVGWAPLPPEARFRHETGFRGWVDEYYDIGPSNYCFVEARDFGARRLRSVFIDIRRNLTIIRETTNITNIYYGDNQIHNDGPQYDLLSKVSRNPINRYKLDRRQRFEEDPSNWREEHGRSRVSDDSFSLFAPSFTSHGKDGPRNTGSKISKPEMNRGWKHAGSEPDVQELRKALRSKIRPPEDLPQRPHYTKPSDSPKPRSDPHEPKVDTPSKGKPSKEQPRGVKDHPPVTHEEMPKQSERPPTPHPDKSKNKENKDPSDSPRPRGNDHPLETEVRKARPAQPKQEKVEPRREPEVRAPKADKPKPQAEGRPKQKAPEVKSPERETKKESKPSSKSQKKPESSSEEKGKDEEKEKEKEKDDRKGEGKDKGKKKDA